MGLINKIMGNNNQPAQGNTSNQSKAMPVSPGRNVQNSSSAMDIAKTTIDEYQNSSGSSDDDRSLFLRGFNEIKNNDNTTSDEQRLAELAINFGSDVRNNWDAINVREPVMNTIAAGITGPTGVIIAETTKAAASNASDGKTTRSVIFTGLDEIEKNPGTSTQDKELAKLGKAFGDGVSNDWDAVKIRKPVIDAIQSGVTGSKGEIIAEITTQAASNASDGKTTRSVIFTGLDEIEKNPGTSTQDKELAKLGKAFGDGVSNDWDAVKIRKPVIDAIQSGVKGSKGEIIAEITTQAASNASDGKTTRSVIYKGLDEIEKNPGTSTQEKELAKLGKAFGDGVSNDWDAVRIRKPVINKIADQPQETPTQSIADVSIEAYDNSGNWETGRYVLRKGFEAVLNNPDATPEEQDLAHEGISAGNGNIGQQQAATDRLDIMKSLQKEAQNPGRKTGQPGNMTKQEMEEFLEEVEEKEEKEETDEVDVAVEQQSATQQKEEQESLPVETEDKINLGDTWVSKRKQAPPPPELE
jgi:hypothetical protein